PYLTLNVPQMVKGLPDPQSPEPRRHENVLSMLDHRANHSSDRIAVGFPSILENKCMQWTYKDLMTISLRMARQIADQLQAPAEGQQIVAIIAPSGPFFLAHVLGCWRLGLAILPIALGTTANGALSLLQSTSSHQILAHPTQKGLVDEITQRANEQKYELDLLKWSEDENLISRKDQTPGISTDIKPEDLLVIFHSSGSSGNPKPIKHPHRFWTPSLWSAFGTQIPAFTTTPLFHGGLSDLLRAFQAGASLYMFGWHEGKAPTPENISKSVAACPEQVGYFLSVPFVLQGLLGDDTSRKMLQRMHLVSTGGAPLPQEVGDEMVQKYDIKLVSRLGSSECGFLMSSWRSFGDDKDWSWLRIEDESSKQWLKFEKQEGEDLYELIVAKEWPSKLLSNRPDGSFATGDLYRNHSSDNHKWIYARRADDGIVMVNGKKIASTPIEDSLKAHEEIRDAIAFGANRPFLGAIVEVKESITAESLRSERLSSILSDVNAKLPSHAKLSQEMIHIVDAKEDLLNHLPRSSKGTLQRGLALEKLQSIIGGIYDAFEQGTAPTVHEKRDLHGSALLEWLRETVSEIADKQMSIDEDLYGAGVDSIKAVRIRAAVHQNIKLEDFRLEQNAVYQYPTIQALAQHIDNRQKAATIGESSSIQDIQERNTYFDQLQWSGKEFDPNAPATVLLTGATGTLGSRILHNLLHDTNVEHIICSVRAKDEEEARSRVIAPLKDRKLDVTNTSHLEERVSFVVHIDTQLPRLQQAKRSIIIHCAWIVNFSLQVSSFEGSCIAPLANLLTLFGNCQYPDRFIFCSSLASVLAGPSPHKEELSTDVASAGSTGYGQSKWIAEEVCASAANSARSHSSNKAQVIVARVGQLCGDSQNGIWNETEAWPLLVRTANEVGCLPKSGPDLDWLRVDVAANAIVELSLN
ncbi:acetyl-CoA synthetase-like protein, partial [Meira miltonrushii]